MNLSYVKNKSSKSLALRADRVAVLRELIIEENELRARIKQLQESIRSLEDQVRCHHETATPMADQADIEDISPGEKEEISDLSDNVMDIDRRVHILDKRLRGIENRMGRPISEKVRNRISRLKELLIEYDGAQTFKRLRSDLKVNPSQFSYLIGILDKRIFEIVSLPGDKRNQKMLRLKSHNKSQRGSEGDSGEEVTDAEAKAER